MKPKNSKPKPIILDNNPLSLLKYAEEYPENFKELCKAEEENRKVWECRNCGCTIYHSKNPEKCSCGNRSSFFENRQATILVNTHVLSALLQARKIVGDEIEKMIKDNESIIAQQYENQEEFVKIIARGNINELASLKLNLGLGEGENGM